MNNPPSYVEEFVSAYVPDQAGLSFSDALIIAMCRDAQAATQLAQDFQDCWTQLPLPQGTPHGQES